MAHEIMQLQTGTEYSLMGDIMNTGVDGRTAHIVPSYDTQLDKIETTLDTILFCLDRHTAMLQELLTPWYIRWYRAARGWFMSLKGQ